MLMDYFLDFPYDRTGTFRGAFACLLRIGMDTGPAVLLVAAKEVVGKVVDVVAERLRCVL